MTKQEQIDFVIILCDTLRDELTARATKWPPEWDGRELRELIAQRFGLIILEGALPHKSKRYRDFVNHCRVENLP